MKTEFSEVQSRIIDTLTRAGEAGMPGHVLMARVGVSGVAFKTEVRLLNEMMGEDIVIWCRVKRDGTPRKAGLEALYLLAQFASEAQVMAYVDFRSRFTESVTKRTESEYSSPVVIDKAEHAVKDKRSYKHSAILRHACEAESAHHRGDIVAEAKATRKMYEIVRELNSL